jgi:hypothetical protein
VEQQFAQLVSWVVTLVFLTVGKIIDIERNVMRHRKKLVAVSRFEGPNYFEALRVRVLDIFFFR